MRRLIRIVASLLVIAVVAAGAAYVWIDRWLDAPLAGLREPTTYEVPRGATLRAIARSLRDRGVLDRTDAWIAWARITGRAGGIKAGEYSLQPGLTPRSLLEHLSSGQVLLHSITFVEGSTFADMRRLLADHPAIRADHADRSAGEVMRELGHAGVHPEGQFFPDTYHFPRNTTDLELLRIARQRMQDELAAAWQDRAPDLPLAGPYEALILASIVEKETALERERAMIAGVFVERLRRGMRLETDPTVIYGMGERYDGNIRKRDLTTDTPYNTYTRRGLPPTPIALPGGESLRAAVRPDVTGAIFFVATGEGDGSHYFSKTLPEHNAAVRRYLRRLRQQ